MTEGERLTRLETQMDNIEEKVDAGFKASEQRHADLKKIMTDFIEKSEDRFASKWVEKAIWGVCTIVFTSVIVAILSLIIKK